MNLQQWLDRLHHELQKRGLPSGYSARLMEELTEHFTDIQKENQGMDAQPSVDEVLGSPELVASTAQKEFFGRTFAGRFGLRRIFGVLTMVMVSILIVAWMRSLVIEDEIYIHDFINLSYGSLPIDGLGIYRNLLVPLTSEFNIITEPVSVPASMRPNSTLSDATQSEDATDIEFQNGEPTIELRQVCQIHHVPLIEIPFSSIVIPLTMLSVFLLFGNGRMPSQPYAPPSNQYRRSGCVATRRI